MILLHNTCMFTKIHEYQKVTVFGKYLVLVFSQLKISRVLPIVSTVCICLNDMC